MDQRVRVRADNRCAARPAHPSRPYPAIEWRQLQAQSEQAPITPFQFRYAGGSSQPSLILVETAPRWGLLPASLMYFCSGEPMHFCSGVDSQPTKNAAGQNTTMATPVVKDTSERSDAAMLLRPVDAI